MGLYRVVVKDGQKALDNLAGATRGEGCPLGMWASFENDIAPNDNWIRAGTTFDATKYPALALYLGSNKVPDRKTVLYYDYKNIIRLNWDTGYNYRFTAPDDGLTLIAPYATSGNAYYSRWTINNGANYIQINCANSNGIMTPIVMKKGDILQLTGGTFSDIDRWWIPAVTKPLFIKATSNMSESEATGLLNLINQRESYSTEEVNTGKKWIDGKPIYRITLSLAQTSDGTALPINNVDEITDQGGYFFGTSTDNMNPFPFTDSTYGRYMVKNPTTNQMFLRARATFYSGKIWAEYTKTTDD